MKRQSLLGVIPVLQAIALVLLAAGLLAGLTMVNIQSARSRRPEKDFLVPWLAAQTFLRYADPDSPERITPYSEPTSQRAQVIYYGRVAEEGEDPLVLWVPFPAHLFYLPLALIPDYGIASGIWMTLAEIALAVSAWMMMRLTGWKRKAPLVGIGLIFPFIWLFGGGNLLTGSPVPFILLASVGSLFALRAGQDEVGGGLLALVCLKMGIFTVLVAFLLWWGLYHRRWRFLAGLGMGLGILILSAFLFLPDWVMPSLGGLLRHLLYTPTLSTSSLLGGGWPVFGPRLGWLLTILLSLLLIAEWRQVRQKGARHLFWTIGLTLAVTPLLGLPISVQDHNALMLPIYLLAAILGERWNRPGSLIAGLVLLALMVVLSWGLAQFPPALLILPALLVIGLYWMRWWAIRPQPSLLETGE